MYKIDLHTHSSTSHDGGIKKKQYISLLERSVLDCVAITDHNDTSFARSLYNELGKKIIVGEEIKTREGEIIGLFLSKTLQPGLTARETISEIQGDGGLVYIPHPFEKKRFSLQEETLRSIIEDVDIIEVFNGRGIFRGKPDETSNIAINENLAMASSSDSHCIQGIGTAYSIIRDFPDKNTLVGMLKESMFQKKYAPLYSLLCPGFNKLKNNLFLGV